METVRWNIEEAVRNYIFENTVESIKEANADLPEMELAGLVDEALEWSRLKDAWL